MRVSSVNIGGSDFGVVTSTDPYVTSFTSPYAKLGGVSCASCSDGSVLDKPYMRDTSGLFLAQRFGQVMGLSSLEKAKSSDHNKVMARATNLSSLTAAWLIKLPPEKREKALEDVAGIAWTNQMLRFAKNIPGSHGITDGVRMSLGMHFMVGILDELRDPSSANAQAYRAFVQLFRTAESELRPSGGLSGLSQVTSANRAKEEAARKAVEEAKNKNLGKENSDSWFCQAVKGIVGPQVGGVICWIVDKGIQMIQATIEMLIKITKTAITALIEFLQALAKGDIMGAIKALMVALTKMLFLLFLPVSKPFFGMEAKDLEAMADKVSKKNPFFIISVILGIVGVLNPTPASISALVLAFTPMIAVMIAPGIAKLTKSTVDAMERGVEQFIKLALIIYQGAMALADILPRLRTQVEAYLTKKGGIGGVVSDAGGKMMDKLKDGWGKLMNSFTKGKFTDLSSVMSSIFSIIPDVLAAMGAEIGAEIPAVDEMVKAIQTAPANVEKQQQALQANSEKFFQALTPQRQEAIVIEQAKKMGLTVSKPKPGTVAAQQVEAKKGAAKKTAASVAAKPPADVRIPLAPLRTGPSPMLIGGAVALGLAAFFVVPRLTKA